MPVIGTLIVDVATFPAKKQEVGLLELTDEMVDRIVDALSIFHSFYWYSWFGHWTQN
ncbi:MAG: hypothetical protein MI799_18690 [Desulfobacterales bacterium]|nr:hypothetical protein [Desulfobacterales bacterium]